MKKIFSITVFLCFANIVFAQLEAPKKTIQKLNDKFAKVADYKADVNLQFDIPNVKMSNINAKVIYKCPNKFRMRAKGIFFLPKQNPLQSIMLMLKDTANYQAIFSNKEMVNNINCSVINIIPIKQMGDLILGKFWIDETKILVMKSEITTKNNGTVVTENKFSTNANYALPDEIKINMDVNKFKIPKMLALDLNKKKKDDPNPTKKENAIIYLHFSNYIINKTISDTEFSDK